MLSEKISRIGDAPQNSRRVSGRAHNLYLFYLSQRFHLWLPSPCASGAGEGRILKQLLSTHVELSETGER